MQFEQLLFVKINEFPLCKRIRLIILSFFILSYAGCFSQSFADKRFYLIDSSYLDGCDQSDKALIEKNLKLYHKTSDFSKRLNFLSNIAENTSDKRIWPKYNQLIMDHCERYLSQKKNQKYKSTAWKYYADALNNIGYLLSNEGKKDQAITYYKKCLTIYKKINFKEGEALCYNNIGSAYDGKGDVLAGLTYYFKSLKIAEKEQLKDVLAVTYSNIGVMYDQQFEYEKSLKYYAKGLKVQRKIGDKVGIATSYNNIGFAYSQLKDEKKALKYYLLSYKQYHEINDKEGVATALGNIGKSYSSTGNNDLALHYFKNSLQYDIEAENDIGIAYTYASIGYLYLDKQNTDSAKAYGIKSYLISKQLANPEIIESAAGLLSKVFEMEQNWKKAHEYQSLFYKMRDSTKNQRNQKESITLGLKYDFEKEKSLAKKDHEKKLALAKKEKENQRLISIFTIGVLLVVACFLVIIFNRFKLTQKQKVIIEIQKNLVEEKNREITDSISYAKRIQSAILPQTKLIKSQFKNSFIYYKPKDIVAGDFYWMEVVDDLVFFAAADCTGHGVPGAMVSVVCHNALNRSVREFNLKKPSEILDKTREIVVAEFEKSEDDVKDGMDISLCVINQEMTILNWAGAHNPLIIVRNNEILEFKADKQPIGKFAYSRPFTNHEVRLFPGDEIYIFTDGLQDQFGGDKGKKFKLSRLKDFLLEHKNVSMSDKVKLLDHEFNSWKGNLEQIDDVCVFGLKI